MLGCCDDIRIVPEATTSQELVEFLWAGISVTPALCCVRGITQADV